MVSLARYCAVLNVIDRVSPISVYYTLEGQHVNFERLLEAYNHKNPTWMYLYTPLSIKAFLPISQMNAVLGFNEIAAKPWAAMKLLKFLFPDLEYSRFCLGAG